MAWPQLVYYGFKEDNHSTVYNEKVTARRIDFDIAISISLYVLVASLPIQGVLQ